MSNVTVAVAANLTLDAAQRVLDACAACAQDLGVTACLAVADGAGNLLGFARMDGAPLLSVGLAQDKAWTVAAFRGVPTHELYDMLASDPAVLHGIVHTPRLIAFGGGVPVVDDGLVVGAVGVSGGTAEQDRQIAEAGADSLHLG